MTGIQFRSQSVVISIQCCQRRSVVWLDGDLHPCQVSTGVGKDLGTAVQGIPTRNPVLYSGFLLPCCRPMDSSQQGKS